MKGKELTLGSLFDGIGGFPYAGLFFGITPVWASEIMPAAVSVTKGRLPMMEHVGDITKLNGATLPPVDIITFGSPCQGLSMAGQRRGLADPRSGLFMEAIRIIREMRTATNGKYPTFALWENVPGALSTAGGLDFKAVLEAFTEAKIPFPQSGKWANAGMVRGGGFDLAWCVYDAKYFGVAQRRRRVFALMDFGGKRAGKILFIPKSLRGYFAAGRTPEQNLAAYSPRGIGGTGGEINANSKICGTLCAKSIAPNGIGNEVDMCILQKQHTFSFKGFGDYTQDGTSKTILKNDKAATGDIVAEELCPVKNRVAVPVNTQTATRHNKLGEGTGFGLGNDGDPAYTLQAAHPHAVFTGPGNCLTPWDTQQARIYTGDGVSATLAGADGGGGRNPAGVVLINEAGGSRVEPIPIHDRATRYNGGGCARNGDGCGNGLGIGKSGDPAPTLTSGDHHMVAVFNRQRSDIFREQDIASTQSARQYKDATDIVCDTTVFGQYQYGNYREGCATLRAMGGDNGGGSENIVVAQPPNNIVEAHPKVSGTLCASGAGMSRPAGLASETDLCVAYCLQGNMIGRQDKNGPMGSGINTEVSFTLSVTDHHAIAAADCKKAVRTGYTVRRLTPTECERLQGYPDTWTAYGHDGKPISDSARYQMLGNSVAVPCVAYILMGIAEQLQFNNFWTQCPEVGKDAES